MFSSIFFHCFILQNLNINNCKKVVVIQKHAQQIMKDREDSDDDHSEWWWKYTDSAN